jgi:predicted RNA-binding protein with PUA-like domain
MAYWLLKTEPESWSWEDQVRVGTEHWNGVRNYQASNNLKKMVLGDFCFFYHSVKERQIVGVVEVCKLYYPDPTDETGRFGMVDVKTVGPLAHPVRLEDIKKTPSLQHLALIRQSRLSVMPIDADSWNVILSMGGGIILKDKI